MNLQIEPVDAGRPTFGARVIGIDVANGVSSEIAEGIEQAMDQYAVLVLPGQIITDAQQYAWSEQFGPMESATGDAARSGERRLSMGLNDISNLDQHGEIMRRDDRRRLFGLGNMLWHSDSSYKTTPSKYSLLSARTIPDSGGETQFADMRAAWDALDAETRARCADLVCQHSQLFSRALLGFMDWNDEEIALNAPVRQRLVRRHARTGRSSLFLSSHAGEIEGWPTPEARIFLRDLTEHATQPEFVMTHRWQQWDLVMWDNRVVMHRARAYDRTRVRDMRRTTVSDCAPTLEQPV